MERNRILITGNLPIPILNSLRQDCELTYHPLDEPMSRGELLRQVKDKDGLLSMITDQVDSDVFNIASRLRIVANMGVGFNNIDVNAATRHSILVSNTPGVLTDTTADLAFALMLAVARRVVEGDKIVREGRFRFWAPFHFLGADVSAKTLGIIGLGRIGKAVARRAQGFNMRILYYSRKRLTFSEERAVGVEFVDLNTLLNTSDFVSLHVPYSEETKYLINEKALQVMKPGAFLINTSRGPVVDENALLAALKEKKIAGAGLDVYEHEPALTPGLADLEQVVLLPHVGSATLETRTRMAAMAAENLLAGLRNERPPNLVNPDALRTSLSS
jgi:glyoxylate reductase